MSYHNYYVYCTHKTKGLQIQHAHTRACAHTRARAHTHTQQTHNTHTQHTHTTYTQHTHTYTHIHTYIHTHTHTHIHTTYTHTTYTHTHTIYTHTAYTQHTHTHTHTHTCTHKPGQQVVLHSFIRWSLPIQGSPPHDGGGLSQLLFCSLRDVPQLAVHSEVSSHSLQPPSTIYIHNTKLCHYYVNGHGNNYIWYMPFN